MDRREYFDNQLREQFRDFRPEPPADAWDAINEGIRRPASGFILPVWLRNAAAAVILAVAGLSFWLLSPDIDDSLLVSETDIIDKQSGENASFFSSIARLSSQGPYVAESTPASNLVAARKNTRGETMISTAPLRAMRAYNTQGAIAQRHDLPQLNPRSQVSSSVIAESSLIRDAVFQNLQDETQGGKTRISVGAHVNTQYSFRQILSSGNFGPTQIPFENLEEPLYTLSYGLSVTFGLSNRLSVQSGVNYLNIGQYLSDIMSFSSADQMPLFDTDSRYQFNHPQTIISSQGSIRLNESSLYFADTQSFRVLTNKQFINNQDPKSLSLRERGISQYTSFVEIPLVVQYRLLESSVGLHIKGGVSGAYLVGNGVYLGRDFFQSPIGETYGLRSLNFSAMGGAILSVPLSGRFSLHLEPTAQIFLKPMVKDELLSGKALPYNFSVFSAIKYSF